MSNEENRDDAGEPQPAVPSRLGKEVKIGVTVIVVLLIAFGAALGVRLKGSSGDDKVASAAASPTGSEKLKGPSTTDALLNEAKAKYFASPSPMVVAAKAAPTEPPKTAAGDVDQWKLASERGQSKPARNDNSMASAPPSFMPDPTRPAHPDQAEPHAFAPRAASDHQPRLLDAPAAKALTEARPLHGAGGSVQPVAPGNEAIRAVSSQGPALTGASSLGPASAPPPPAPSRVSLPAEPPPPAQLSASLPPGPSYSPAATSSAAPMPVAQVTTDDYRREPASSRYNSGESRRAVAAPSYSPPARREDGKYEVQPNDNYWTISEKLYGTSAYFKALAHHNNNAGAEDDRLKPGELILAPPLAELEKSYPGLCPRASRREAQQSQSQSRVSAVGLRGSGRGGRTYTVVEGDTLFNIARNELGKASRWAEIYDLNRDVLGKDFNYLTPGTPLTLPEGQKSDVVAQPPSDSYRR